MYPNNGYVPPQRTRRSDRYAAENPGGQTSSAAGWQQPGNQQQIPPQYQQPVQAPRGIPPQAQQFQQGYQPQSWQAAPQQDYGRGYHPQQDQWNYSQPRYNGQRLTQGYQPVQPENGGGERPPSKFNWKLIAIAAVLLVVLAVGVVIAKNQHEEQKLKNYVAGFDNVYCQNVYVDGIHLGGMTQQEALDAVTAKAQQRNNAWSVKLTYQGQLVTELNASQLGMTVDVYEQLRQAWNQGHSGDAHARLAAMETLAETPYQAYSALPSGDTSVVDNVLAQIRDKVYRAPQDAALVSFDPQKTSNPFTFQEEVAGRVLDTEPIKEKIYQMVSTMESGSIEIEPASIQPKVTVADLQKQVALRASASTTISYKSEEGRTNNIRRAFQLISGTILQPGDTFSFNKLVGERSVENGFYEADEYAYQKITRGVGGGVCQASSTVYQAAVAAGMQITKREQHSLPVNYTELGLDATVYWSKNRKIDFAFKNSSDMPVYIAASVQMDPDNRRQWIAKVSIYGADMGNVAYKLEAAVTEVLPAPEEPKYVKDKKQEYVTYVDEEHITQKAEEGCVVDSYCVKYVDGVATERTHMYTDRYEPKQKTIYVGIKEREE